MKISIPKPCSEDWSQMTASEKGRFCASCQTQVISFVGMQAKEIKDILEQETGSSCGRFSTHQLEAFNAAYQELPSPSSLRNWTMAAVLTGVSVLPIFAQDSSPALAVPLLNTSISYYHYQTETTEIISASDTVVLVGQVIGLDNNEALPFAQVIVTGTKIGATTDLDGKFMLKVPKSKEAITLAKMSRELFNTDWIKLEVIGDDYNLQPDPIELLTASEALIKEGKNDKAEEILDLSIDKMPVKRYGHFGLVLGYPDAYYQIGKKEKARNVANTLVDIL